MEDKIKSFTSAFKFLKKRTIFTILAIATLAAAVSGQGGARNHLKISMDGLAVIPESGVQLEWQSGREEVAAARVTSELFSILGIEAHLGRIFHSHDDHHQARPVALLSFELWESRFDANPEIVGSQILLNQRRYKVVGVLPADIESRSFGWVTDVDVWLPLSASVAVEDPEVILELL